MAVDTVCDYIYIYIYIIILYIHVCIQQQMYVMAGIHYNVCNVHVVSNVP